MTELPIFECGLHRGSEPFLEILDAAEKYISIETVQRYTRHGFPLAYKLPTDQNSALHLSVRCPSSPLRLESNNLVEKTQTGRIHDLLVFTEMLVYFRRVH